MLILKRVVIEGFMAVRKADITFPKTGVIFISGNNLDNPHLVSNGAGKSTLLDAISFALYGKPVRSINKADLLPDNGVSPGFVYVRFIDTNDGANVSVKRWLKRSAVEVRINKVPIKIDANAIGAHFNLDHKTFKNIHVLTKQESFVFESQASRLQLFERFTGLDELISNFKLTAKALDVSYSSSATKVQGKLEQMELEIEELEERLAQYKATDTKNLQREIELLRAIVKLQCQIRDMVQDVVVVLSSMIAEAGRKLQSKNSVLTEMISRFRSELSVLASNKETLTLAVKKVKKGYCEACGARLNIKYQQQELDRLGGQLTATLKQIDGVTKKLLNVTSAHKANVQTVNARNAKIEGITERLVMSRNAVMQKRDMFTTRGSTIATQLAVAEDRKSNVEASIVELRASIEQARHEFAKFSDLSTLAQGVRQFIDKQLRHLVLKNYLESFNKDLKVTLDLFAGFPGHFDEKFNITLINRPFNACSTGEQMRFVLACYMNLFRYSSTNKNRFNFLGFDDFDLGVDEAGIDDLAEVFQSMGRSMLLFVLSQNKVFMDKFDTVLEAKMEKGITTYEFTKV